MGNAIEIKGLRKTYKKVVAVDGIDLSVDSGELFLLLGENGAGKTTTVKILCSLIDYDEGDIKIFGLSLKENRQEIKKFINVSPQESAVASNLSVKENLMLIANVYEIENAEKRVDELISEFNLSDVENKRAKTLSGGYKRRLSLAMALVSNPKLLFLDEPMLGLDVRSRRELWRIIGKLKGKVTIVLTTHYLEEAEQLSDKIAIMKKGKIKALGTIDEIKKSAGESSFEDAFLKITGDNYEEN